MVPFPSLSLAKSTNICPFSQRANWRRTLPTPWIQSMLQNPTRWIAPLLALTSNLAFFD